MFNALFNIIIDMIATLIQVICYIPNQTISTIMPGLADSINEVTSVFSSMFSGIGWALGIIPASTTALLSFIIVIEIAKNTIFISTHTLINVWNLFQKVKFW